jgi:hypothetical protein
MRCNVPGFPQAFIQVLSRGETQDEQHLKRNHLIAAADSILPVEAAKTVRGHGHSPSEDHAKYML